ncbi:PHP domain [Nakaseomyces glabratus]|nr:histidinol phosphatase [Nakaseomyces glabratus]
MHSHHSHSGDYVAHGVDPLDDIVAQAVAMRFHTYCLTEHMPRVNSKYLYPEERQEDMSPDPNIGELGLKVLKEKFLSYLEHSRSIRAKYSGGDCKTKFLVGCELECCDVEHIEYSKYLLRTYGDDLKFTVGSIHHIRGIPIDFDPHSWNEAFDSCDKNIVKFLSSYFDMQHAMITELQPIIIGHFDLYKLLLPDEMFVHPATGDCSDDPQVDFVPITSISLVKTFPILREKIIRNLKAIDSYGGAIEINTAGFRKGLCEPYPGPEICELAKQYCGSRFVLSDDAHAVSHVGTCYKQALDYITNTIQIEALYHLEETSDGSVKLVKEDMASISENSFWKQF